MNSNKKLGRPKGEDKVLYRKRVSPELVEKVDGYLSAAIKARHEGNLQAIAKWHLETYGEGATVPEPKFMEHQFENKGFTEANLKALEPHANNQVKLLLDDVERLTRENAELEGEIQRLISAPMGEVIDKLQFRIKELEKKVKDYEQTYG